MLTASDKFVEALNVSHRRLVRVGLWSPDQNGDYELQGYVGVVEGSLTINNQSNTRRTATMTVAPLQAEASAGLLGVVTARDFLEQTTAESGEITIEWGIEFPDLTIEYVQIARLRIEEWTVSAAGGAVKITSAMDAGQKVADFNLVTPYAPYDINENLLTYTEAISDLITTSYPSASPPTISIDAAVDQTSFPPENTVFSGSRWQAIQDLAKAIDADVAVGADGGWTIKPERPPAVPVWRISAGENGTLVAEETSFSRREMYNAVPIRWSDPSGTGSGLVYLVDNDPNSPTYYDGPFGRKPRPEETIDTITSEAQAIEAATTLLDKYSGRTRSIKMSAVHMPLLETGDVINVRLPNGDSERHVIDTITLPLGSEGVMSVTTRIVRTAETYESVTLYNEPALPYEG